EACVRRPSLCACRLARSRRPPPLAGQSACPPSHHLAWRCCGLREVQGRAPPRHTRVRGCSGGQTKEREPVSDGGSTQTTSTEKSISAHNQPARPQGAPGQGQEGQQSCPEGQPPASRCLHPRLHHHP